MKNLWKNTINLGLAISFLAVMAPKAYAVPAFGRAMGGADCSACHQTPTWQLNHTGLEFLKNGHRVSATKDFDSKGFKLDNYLSLVWKGRAYNNSTTNGSAAAMAAPKSQFEHHSFALYTGGALSDRVSYFTELYLSENTQQTTASTVNGYDGDAARKKLAEAFLQYNLPVTDSSFVAFRAGEILPEIIHTFGVGARSIEDRAQIMNVGANTANPYKPFTRSQGVDAKFNMDMLEVTFGVVNGAMATTNAIDSNNHKDTYASAQFNFGTHGSALGIFRYDGVYTTHTAQDNPASAPLFKNKFSKNALLGRFVQDKYRLTAVYMMGEEQINGVAGKPENKGYYALVDYNFSNSLGLFGRYDFLDPRDDTSFSEIKVATIGANGLLYANVNSAARWNLELSQRKTGKADANAKEVKIERVFAQLTWAL